MNYVSQGYLTMLVFSSSHHKVRKRVKLWSYLSSVSGDRIELFQKQETDNYLLEKENSLI